MKFEHIRSDCEAILFEQPVRRQPQLPVEATLPTQTQDNLSLMKASLKQERWKPLDVGGEQNWNTRIIKSKWQFQRDTWRMSKN